MISSKTFQSHFLVHNRVYFSFRKTTLCYVSPSQNLQTSLVIDVYFLIFSSFLFSSSFTFQNVASTQVVLKLYNCQKKEKPKNVHTLQSGINVGPTFINFEFFSRPYSLIKDPTFIKFWNFYQGLQKFSSLMGFLLHKFPHFVYALRLFKALRLFFLTNFPGPTVIPCPTYVYSRLQSIGDNFTLPEY